MDWNPVSWLKKLLQFTALPGRALDEDIQQRQQQALDLSLRTLNGRLEDSLTLDFARLQKVSIIIDASLAGSDETARYDADKNTVLVNPGRLSDTDGLRAVIKGWHDGWIAAKTQEWEALPEAEKQSRLMQTKSVIQSAPLTYGLWELAEELQMPIRFEAALIGSVVGAQVRTEENAIHINPFPLGPLDEIVGLVHELRHVWQLRNLKLTHDTYEMVTKSSSLAHMMLVRTMEADAYAFGDLFTQHLFDIQKEIATETSGDRKRRLSPSEQFNVVSRLDDRKRVEYPAVLQAAFAARLETLGTYDMWTMRANFQRYSRAEDQPSPASTSNLTLGALKGMLKSGIEADDVNYMQGVSDLRFGAALMRDVQPGLRRALRLMKYFDCAIRKNPAANTAQSRKKIEEAMVDAVLCAPTARQGLAA